MFLEDILPYTRVNESGPVFSFGPGFRVQDLQESAFNRHAEIFGLVIHSDTPQNELF
jgi:hypothetical protein